MTKKRLDREAQRLPEEGRALRGRVRRRQREAPVHFRQDEAEIRAKLRKLLADRDEGIAYDNQNLTVGDYLDRWLGAVKGSVRDRTWWRHEEVVRLHLKPTIGGVKLDKLNALQVQNVCSEKLNAGLSPRSVDIHVALHKALKQAVRWSLVPRNVLDCF